MAATLLSLSGISAAQSPNITEYVVPNAGNLSGIVTGSDGDLWFTKGGSANRIGSMYYNDGVGFTEYAVLPTAGSNPFGIAADLSTANGPLWFTENSANKIGRITLAGTVSEIQIPTPNSGPWGIAVGSGGTIWFTENSANQIGRIPVTGGIQEFPILTANSQPRGIALGPDGAMWFTEANVNKIGRISPTSPFTIQEFVIPTPNSVPTAITSAFGWLWFTEANGNKIGRISATSPFTIQEFPIPTAGSNPSGITVGGDCALWFAEQSGNKIGRIDSGVNNCNPVPNSASNGVEENAAAASALGTITEFSVPTANSGPSSITLGLDGALWFTELLGRKIGRLSLVITTASLPKAAQNKPYSFQLEAQAGKTPYSWSATGLPPGLTISGNGLLSGTPTSLGGFKPNITVYSSDFETTVEKTFDLAVEPPLTITTSFLPAGVISVMYDLFPGPTTLQVQNGTPPYSWRATGLPPGMTLSSTGSLGGTPSALGIFNVNATVDDNSSPPQSASRVLPLQITNPVTFTPTTLPNGQVNVPYPVITFQGQGGIPPYSFIVPPVGLPPGLTMTAAGVLSGTPTTSGTFNVNVSIRDSNTPPQPAAMMYSVTIAPPNLVLTCNPMAGPPTVGLAYTANCSVTGGTAPYSWSVSPGSLPAGLTLNSTGNSATVTGTPTAPGAYSYSVRVSDSGTQVRSQAYSGTITTATLTCTPTTGPAAVGATYTATCNVTGGTAPYTWAINPGSLPAGLTLNATGSSATVSGTPTTAGPYSYSVRVTDSGTTPQARSQAYSGTITTPTLNCTPTTGPTAVGAAYTATCNVTGGTAPYTWGISPGSLPAGLTLNATGSSATVSGTPTAAGSYSYNVRVTDSGTTPQAGSQAYSGTITALTLNCTPTTGPSTVGLAYSATCSATGGTAPYTFAISPGSLPAGLALNATGNSATVSGTPTAAGPYSYSVRVTDSATTPQSGSQAYSGTITALTLNCPTTTGPSTVGLAYSATCTATGGTAPYTFAISPGSLPAGLTLNATGNSATVSGTPTAAGSYTYSVGVTDSGTTPQAKSQAYSGTITALTLNCNPTTGPPTVGMAYSATCNVTGGTAPYSWAINPGSLPAGLALNATGSSATVSGTPTALGPYSYSVRVTDSGTTPQSGSQAYSGTVTTLELNCNPTTGPPTVGRAYSATCTVTGGTTPYSWSISPGSLPAGLTLNATGSSATVSGTPTAAGPYSYSVRVTDSGTPSQSGSQAYSGTVTALTLDCTPTTGPPAVGAAYTATCNVTGGTAPYTFVISPGSLPAGLALNAAGSSATVSGNATAAGPYSYSVEVTDSGTIPQLASQAYSGTITALALNCTPTTGPSAVGIAYTATCNVTGATAPYSWSISPGSLPAGLTLNATGSSATVSGTPTAAGPYSYSVRVTDGGTTPQSGSRAYSGTITALVLDCNPTTGPSTVGLAYTATCNVTGASAPYSWSISPGSLPAGLTLNATGSTATISGKATAQGPFSFSIRVTEASSPQRTATQAYTGTVSPLAVPTMNITVEPTSLPTDSAPFAIQLSEAAPVALKGTLSLSFRASPAGLEGATSPTNPQFMSGGNTLDFEIPAGASSAVLQNPTINQGIVAGDITLSLTQLTTDNVDVTPTSSVSRTITVPNLPPVIVPGSVRFVNTTANGFQVELMGYSTPRDLLQARYTFEVASGAKIEGSATLDVDLVSAANQWFGNVEQSYSKYGSSFLLRMQFTVDGNANLLTAVTVSLRNSAGVSTQVTARK